MAKNSPVNAGDTVPSLGLEKFPWRMKWQPTPVFLPGKFHGSRSVAAYSPWSCKELDTTEHAHIIYTCYSGPIPR